MCYPPPGLGGGAAGLQARGDCQWLPARWSGALEPLSCGAGETGAKLHICGATGGAAATEGDLAAA